MVAVFIRLIAVDLELASSAQSLVFRIVLDGGTIFHRIYVDTRTSFGSAVW